MVSLLKILYLADRKSLIRRGKPITGDQMFSMPHGPVLSRIYDLIKTGDDTQPWYEYLMDREANTISLRSAPHTDELSDFERGILREEFDQYRTYTFGELKALTHELPEYKDPNGGSLPDRPNDDFATRWMAWEEIREASASAYARVVSKLP